MTDGLKQAGNISSPSGFQCAVAPTNHYVFCWGGTISAAGSVQFQLDVVVEDLGGRECGYPGPSIRAVADPYNWIPEASEVNNEAVSRVGVACIN